jgi:hypothetical protein
MFVHVYSAKVAFAGKTLSYLLPTRGPLTNNTKLLRRRLEDAKAADDAGTDDNDDAVAGDDSNTVDDNADYYSYGFISDPDTLTIILWILIIYICCCPCEISGTLNPRYWRRQNEGDSYVAAPEGTTTT